MSRAGKLDAKDADTLIKYMKLVHEIVKDDKKEAKEMTDEELAAIAAGKVKT